MARLLLLAATYATAFQQLERRPVAPVASFDPLGLSKPLPLDVVAAPAPLDVTAARRAALVTAVAATTAFPDAAAAKGGEFGLAEGRIISLAHPVAMGGCFLATLYAGYTGLQWRSLRGLGVELQAAKKDAKAAAAAVTAAVAAVEGEDDADHHAPPELVAVQARADAVVAELTEKRATIAAGNFRDAHYQMGTVLLAVGIPMALEGPVNTYMRAGKLFPGAHVYAGVGVASLWAVAAALVPEMQKGKDWARSAHIGVNAITFGLFAYYQIPTGLTIAAKVIEKTKFP